MNATLGADDTASFIAAKLRAQEPFSYWRFGDGFIELAIGRTGGTCDGERYAPELRNQLVDCWNALLEGGGTVYFGDWLSASFNSARDPARYQREYEHLLSGRVPQWLHFEALLLMRESEALIDFYRAVRQDPRRKLFMGPVDNACAAAMLGADHLETPMRDLIQHTEALTAQLLAAEFDVLLFGAGMAGNIPAVKCWEQHPERTYLHLGSALDPLGRGRSRKQQITPARAQVLFQRVISE